MGKHVLSIEIGQQVTKVVEIDYKKKNPHVYRAITFATPDEVIQDGVIRDKEALAVVMKNELKEAGMKEKSVVFSIASSKIATREVTLPHVKENKIAGLVKATAQEYFPIDLSDYVLAHSVLETIKEEGGKSYKVLLLAAPEELIVNYYNFAAEMGFKVESIDYFGNGSMQVLSKEIVLDYCICIQISGSATMVTFMNEGQQLMQRTINAGVFDIAQAMVESEESQYNDMDVACEALCRDQLVCKTLDYEGLGDASVGTRMTDEQWARMNANQSSRKVVTDAVGEMLLSIMRVVDFFKSKYQGITINSIYITGMGCKVRGIDELFTNELHVPTRKMEHLVNITFPRHFSEGLYNETEYIAVCGAAIAPVDFKSNSAVNAQSHKDNMQLVQLVFGLSVVAAVAMIGISLLGYYSAKKDNDNLTARKQSLSYISDVYNENTEITRVADQVNGIYTSTQTQNENLNSLISQLESKLPDTMTVSMLQSNADGIAMTIESDDDISIARMLMNLEQIDVLTNLSIPSVTAADQEDGSTKYDFSITANYVVADAAASPQPAQ